MPRTHAWPVKLATLVFSLGLATVAVARAGLAGCDGAPRARQLVVADDHHPATPLPQQTPPWQPPEEPPPDYFGGAKSDGEVWPTRPRAVPQQPPPDYFGGAKSDADVWPPDAPLRPDAWFHLYTLERRLAEPPPEPPPPRYFGGAKADPFAMPETSADRKVRATLEDYARTLPPDYFGGAKSDAEVWGGLTRTEIGEAYGIGGLGDLDEKPRKRGRR